MIISPNPSGWRTFAPSSNAGAQRPPDRSRRNPLPAVPSPDQPTRLARAGHPGSPRPRQSRPWIWTGLLDFTDGDPENLRELVTLYLDQTADNGATRGRRPGRRAPGGAPPGPQLRRRQRHLRHAPAGAAAARTGTPGLRRATSPTPPSFASEAATEFERIRHFLEAYLADARQSRRQILAMKKILIVEDDQIVANIYRNKFSRRGLSGGNRPGRPGRAGRWCAVSSPTR